MEGTSSSTAAASPTGDVDNEPHVRELAPPVLELLTMVSSTQQFERIRKRKATTNGKRNKRERRALGTPKFAVHQAGYDATAADAKKAEKA
jgi:hypothetical protein